jgi:tRNA dimethylallyltransferase
VVVLFGPTASGKSRLLSQTLPGRGELINSDSIQVYQHLNIGSAKANPEDMSAYPHHLVDFLDPREPFTAGVFCRLAEDLVWDIHSRGLLPVISGGTGFYFKTLLYGGPKTPEADPKIRKQVQSDLEKHGLAWLYQELREIDPSYAAKIAPQDALRVRRATEVYRQTGQPLSSFAIQEEVRQDWDLVLLGIHWPRETLYRRIDERVDRMIEMGLQKEVQGLLDKGYSWEDPGLKAIGYQEWELFFEGEIEVDEVLRLIKRNSRRYAKRQITFFKGLPKVHWLDGEDLDAGAALLGGLLSP